MRLIICLILTSVLAGVIRPMPVAGQDPRRRVLTERKATRSAIEILQDCAACHQLSEDPQQAAGLPGPSLFALYGRPIGADPNFAYSEALAGQSGVWDRRSLMAFLERPDYFAKDTNMHFRGITAFQERRRLIAWFKQQRDKADANATVPATLTEVLSAGDRQAGAVLARRCRSCHAVTVDTEQRGRFRGPSLINIVGRKMGSVAGFDYRAGYYDQDKSWTKARLNRFFLAPTKFEVGSHASFQQLDSAKKRADLIAYLAGLDRPAKADLAKADKTP